MGEGSGWKLGERAPAKCYMDNIEAWSVNECTINWNTPLAWVSAYLADKNGGVIVTKEAAMLMLTSLIMRSFKIPRQRRKISRTVITISEKS